MYKSLRLCKQNIQILTQHIKITQNHLLLGNYMVNNSEVAMPTYYIQETQRNLGVGLLCLFSGKESA